MRESDLLRRILRIAVRDIEADSPAASAVLSWCGEHRAYLDLPDLWKDARAPKGRKNGKGSSITGQNNGRALPAMNGNGGSNGGSSLPDNIVQPLMSYRIQAPLVDELLEELGFEAKGGLAQMASRMSDEIGGLGSETKVRFKTAMKSAPENDEAAGDDAPKEETS